MSHLAFARRERPNENKYKTKLWDVLSADSGSVLGRVGWYTHWRRYVFIPPVEQGQVFFFDAKCLREIAEFCENETHKHQMQIRLEREENASAQVTIRRAMPVLSALADMVAERDRNV